MDSNRFSYTYNVRLCSRTIREGHKALSISWLDSRELFMIEFYPGKPIEDSPNNWECYRCSGKFTELWKFCDADFNPICDKCFDRSSIPESLLEHLLDEMKDNKGEDI